MASRSSLSRTISINSSTCSSKYLPKEVKNPRNQPSNVSNSQEPDPVYPCRICSKTFYTIQGLAGHQNAHRGHKLFEIKRPASKANDKAIDLDDLKGKKKLQSIDQHHPLHAHYRRDNVDLKIVENDIHVAEDIERKGKAKLNQYINDKSYNLHHPKFNLQGYDEMLDLKISDCSMKVIDAPFLKETVSPPQYQVPRNPLVGAHSPSKNLIKPLHPNPPPTLNLFPMSCSIRNPHSHPTYVSPTRSSHPTQRACSNQMARVSNPTNTNFIRKTQGGFVPFHANIPLCCVSNTSGFHQNMVQGRPNPLRVHNFVLEQRNKGIQQQDLDLELKL